MSNIINTKAQLFVNHDHVSHCDVFQHRNDLTIPVEQFHNIKSELEDENDDPDSSAVNGEDYLGQQYNIMNLQDEPCVLGEQLQDVKTEPEHRSDDLAMNLNSYQIKQEEIHIKMESLNPEHVVGNIKSEPEHETDCQDLSSLIVEDPLGDVNTNYQIKFAEVNIKDECPKYEEGASQDSMVIVTLPKEPIPSSELHHFSNDSNADCKSSSPLAGHTKHEQTDIHEKPFVCDMCNKSFRQSKGLSIHKKRIHTVEKPYACDVCNKSFSLRASLTSHKQTHTGEKPYVCNVCNKSFSRSKDLPIHKRIHTDEEPYVCDVCNKSFNHNTTLITHKRTHTGEKPYVCDVCNKSFNQRASFITHKRTHTGEKPYVCDVCNKSFNHSSSLKTHKQTHTGEKPYGCDVCDKRFSVRTNLKLHKQTHMYWYWP